MKKSILYISIICLALSLQGCPITNTNHATGLAYLLSVQDTVEVVSYNMRDYVQSEVLYPKNTLQYMAWTIDRNDPNSLQNDKLQITKQTNHAESLVIIGQGVYINDKFWHYHSITNMSLDEPTVSEGLSENKGNFTNRCPYSLAEIIEQLSLHYPHLLLRINDVEPHYVDNYEATVVYEKVPKIYINQ